MDRSRRAATAKAAPAVAPPAASKLTFRPKKNRRRQGSLWERMPRPRQIADACGRALRRAAPGIAALGALAALGGTAWAGYRFVTTSSRFEITNIEIRGNQHLTGDDIRAALPVQTGDNVFRADLAGLVRVLRENPWIEDADAHRVLPHTIEITIRERIATAVVELDGLYLVDTAGTPFKRAETATHDGDGLPVITGLDRNAYLANPVTTAATIRSLVGVWHTWRSNSERPSIGELHVDAHGTLTLHAYEQPTAIQLGALGPELAARMQTFDAVWAELGDAERARVRDIHLDARPDQITVAFARN